MLHVKSTCFQVPFTNTDGSVLDYANWARCRPSQCVANVAVQVWPWMKNNNSWVQQTGLWAGKSIKMEATIF